MAKITTSFKHTSEVKFRKLLEEAKNSDKPEDFIRSIEKDLKFFEDKYKMTSQEFYDKFSHAEIEEKVDFFKWWSDYEIYLRIKSLPKPERQEYFV